MLKFLISLVGAIGLGVAFGPAVSGDAARADQICSDMDGDGTAETCIEIDRDESGTPTDAHFPGQDPPEVPDPGEGVPVEDSDD